MGIADEKLSVISGIPFNQDVLGRPNFRSIIPRLAMGGAMIGLVAALFLIFGIPGLYPLTVGGQPVFPFPPFLIIGFELSMLGLMGTAFVGLLLAGHFPSYEPKMYVPEISDGKIALVFSCPAEQQSQFEAALVSLGAEQVKPVEATVLSNPAFKRLIIAGLFILIAAVVVEMFAFDMIKINWISFMDIQPAFQPISQPLPVATEATPVQGPAYDLALGVPSKSSGI